VGLRALAASAAVFAFLAVAAWWILGRESGSPPGPFCALKRRLPDTLTVVMSQDTTVVVPGGEGGWRVIRPVDYPADGVVMEAMVKRLAAIEVDRRFPLVEEKMDTYGIRIPRGRIRAAYRDGASPDTLTIGAFTFDDQYDYVRAGSRPEVGLLSARLYRGFLLKSTGEIRDTRLLPFAESRAVGFRLLGEQGEVHAELARDSSGVWALVRPYPGPASIKKVGEYLESLSHMHLRTFVREGNGPLEPYGLDRPKAGVRIRLEGGGNLGLSLGDPVAGTDLIYAATLARPHIFGVSEKYLQALQRDADAFRRPAVVGFGLAQVTRVTVSGGGLSWNIDLRARSDSLSRELRDVLGNWVFLEARRFEEATPGALRAAGLLAPARSLLWWAGSDTLARVDLGRPVAGDTPLRVGGGLEARPGEVLYAKSETVEPLYRYLEEHRSSP